MPKNVEGSGKIWKGLLLLSSTLDSLWHHFGPWSCNTIALTAPSCLFWPQWPLPTQFTQLTVSALLAHRIISCHHCGTDSRQNTVMSWWGSWFKGVTCKIFHFIKQYHAGRLPSRGFFTRVKKLVLNNSLLGNLMHQIPNINGRHRCSHSQLDHKCISVWTLRNVLIWGSRGVGVGGFCIWSNQSMRDQGSV